MIIPNERTQIDETRKQLGHENVTPTKTICQRCETTYGNPSESVLVELPE